jgi:hypothetical protein
LLYQSSTEDFDFSQHCVSFVADLCETIEDSSAWAWLKKFGSGDPFYMEPQFSSNARKMLLLMPIGQMGMLDDILCRSAAKRAYDTMPCAAHDLIPICGAALGVMLDEKEDADGDTQGMSAKATKTAKMRA